MENNTHTLRRLLGSFENVIVFSLCCLLSYMVILPIQRLYFHPLSKFPGPRLWAISRIPFAYYIVRGDLHFHFQTLHAKYGYVVRVAPNELSYIAEDAYNDIYQADKITRQQLSRDPKLIADPPDGGPHGIIFATNEDDHARMRRNLNPMFSESAMRAQEPILKGYIDLLIQRLHEICSEPVDIVAWLNYTTFDIIGDLTFGESFDCLKTSKLHFWIKNVFSWIKSLGFMGMALKLSPLDKILTWMVPKSLIEQMNEHQEYANAKLARRLDRTDGRQDFLTYAHEHLDTPAGMSMGELRETAALLILAGSETSGTSLAGQVYYASTYPVAFERLKAEIRTTFEHEEDISIQSVSSLPYTLAFINEALRLFPPVPISLAQNRITPPEGTFILGEHVAGGTIVAMQQYAAYHSPRNFKDPDLFIPERWLPEGQDRYGGDKKKVLQPFGFGPRICIGKSLAYAEMKMILARLVWNFDIELRDVESDWPTSMKAFVIWEKKPLWVRLRPVKRS